MSDVVSSMAEADMMSVVSSELDEAAEASVLERSYGSAREFKICGSRTREDPVPPPSARPVTYGGNFTWVGAPYKMRVSAGLSPLQWLNGLTKRLLVLEDISLHADGGFRRPGESVPMFPRKGVDLRWRWEAEERRIVVDFSADGRPVPWRWDELRPSEDLRFPSTVPDLLAVGHVGKFTFEYSLLSAAAERPELPLRGASEDLCSRSLPGSLAQEPRGAFELDDACATAGEMYRDFARVLLSGGSPRLFLMCPGFQEPVPLGRTSGATIANLAGNLDPEVAKGASRQFTDQLYEALAQACRPSELPPRCFLDGVVERVAMNTSAAVGIGFAASQELLPLFLQPVYAIVCLGQPLEFRVLTYGFVAGDPSQVQGDRPDTKFSPFVVRLLSSELSMAPPRGQALQVRYVASPAQDPSTASCLWRDAPLFREAMASAQWSQLF